MSSEPPVYWERPEEAVAALLSIYGVRDLSSEQRALLLSEYARRIHQLEEGDRHRFNEELIALIGNRGPRRYVVAPGPDCRSVDVALVAVQPVEMAALRHTFGDPAVTRSVGGRKYYEVSLTSNNSNTSPRSLTVVLTATMSPYNVRNAVAITEIARSYSPQLWILVGMAAGVRGKVEQGDVVLPTVAWYYEPGRLVPSRFEPRPELAIRGDISQQLYDFDVGAPLVQDRLREAARSVPPRFKPARMLAGWSPSVSVRSDAVASGEKLLRDGETLLGLHGQNERIVIGDQESYGFAISCGAADWLIARGVADYGDVEKNDDWQFLATAMACETVAAFLEDHYMAPRLTGRF